MLRGAVFIRFLLLQRALVTGDGCPWIYTLASLSKDLRTSSNIGARMASMVL